MFKLNSISRLLKGGEMMKTLGLVLALSFVLGGACFAAPITLDFYEGWNLISTPVVPFVSDPSVMFGAVPYDGLLYRFDSPTQSTISYDSIDPSGFGNVLLGDGYWLFQYAPGSITIADGQYIPDGVPDGTGALTDMWISLPGNQYDGVDAGGWNFIGQPFNHDTAVDGGSNLGDKIFLTDGTTLKTWGEAVIAGWCDAQFAGFNGATQSSAYVTYDGMGDDDHLRAGKGYRFQTYKDNLALIIPAAN